MPHVTIPITKAWKFGGEPDRIHYMVQRADESARHLYVDRGHPLFEVLEEHLAAIGYEGPHSRVVQP